MCSPIATCTTADTSHVLELHPRLAPHVVPQAPQWAAAVRRSTSHPFASVPSQVPNPTLQEATSQNPALHVALALASPHESAAPSSTVASQSSSIALQRSVLPGKRAGSPSSQSSSDATYPPPAVH
ncbi:MAG: hypothetical protein M5U28_22475 [Sandaracinaceae bacterium]|nr:hypothetical protein [Sandaracinaceae bacterium]